MDVFNSGGSSWADQWDPEPLPDEKKAKKDSSKDKSLKKKLSFQWVKNLVKKSDKNWQESCFHRHNHVKHWHSSLPIIWIVLICGMRLSKTQDCIPLFKFTRVSSCLPFTSWIWWFVILFPVYHVWLAKSFMHQMVGVELDQSFITCSIHLYIDAIHHSTF